MFGIVNLNKPSGMTSRAAVDHVGRIVGKVKLGHAGTLDPIAHGVLLICLGQATRLVPLLHELPKRYRATYLLGRTSPTDDTESEITVSAPGVRPDVQAIEALLPRFTGEIQQTPPDYSAVKIHGRRAYDLARRGARVTLAAKTVVVHRIDLVSYSYPELILDVRCGTGTYLRSLGRDIGHELGVGAVMSALCRTSIGPFHVDAACALEALTATTLAAHIQSPRAAVAHLEQVELTDDQVTAIRHGQTIEINTAVPSKRAAAVDRGGQLVAIVEVKEANQLKPVRVFH